MRRPLFTSTRRTTGAPIDPSVEALAADAVERALPEVVDLQVTALDDPSWRAGAEAMRDEVLRILRSQFPGCNCHPAYHEIGAHAPIGNSRPVTP